MNNKLTQLLAQANLRKTGWNLVNKPHDGFILCWGFSVMHNPCQTFLELGFCICLDMHFQTDLGCRF